MGNRAVITTEERKVSLYLHWNGGRDSVEGFLEYCNLRGFRPPSYDSYGWARLCQVIGNYFGGDGLSVGIDRYTDDEHEDPGDNGIYVIEGWRIAERLGLWEGFEEQRVYPLPEMLLAIDDAQPAEQRLGEAFLSAVQTNTLDIRPGDSVFLPVIGGTFEPVEVVSIAPEGSRYPGLPVVARYCSEDGSPDLDNPNNYLRADCYRVAQTVAA